MTVMVLVILEQARHHMTVHTSETEALKALGSYVSQHWRAVINCAFLPASNAERIDRFFKASGSDYFIAEVDLDISGAPGDTP